MKAKLLSYCKEGSLFSPGDRVICALSGGADSMALTHCLHSLEAELEITVEAAHFNHKLRGEESDEDQGFVAEFCHKEGIPLHLGSADVADYSRQHRLGIEEAARQCRYRFFETLSGKIATAHTADDHLETVLMHLIRGSGLRGLCGIPPVRDNILRPLLWATREEILCYLEVAEIPYRDDSSNSSSAYTRNRLRHKVIPLLKEENPDLSHGVFRQSAILRQEDRFLDEMAKSLLQKSPEGAFDLVPIRNAPEPLQNRALRLMVSEYLEQDVSQTHIESLRDLVYHPCPSAQVSLPQGLTACRNYDSLQFRQNTDTGVPSFSKTFLQIPGETELPEIKKKITCEVQKNFAEMTNTPFHFAIKYDMIDGLKILVRPRQVGDRLQTADGHRKSLKKWMIEKKIPRHERDLLPILADGEHVLAVAGFGVSSHCRPVEGQPALIISIENI